MRCEPAVCASHSTVKNPSGATGESKALSDVPIMIPKREDDPSKSKETEGTAEVKSNCCQSGTDIRACIDEGCWQAGRTETSTRTLEVCCQRSVKTDSDWWFINGPEMS